MGAMMDDVVKIIWGQLPLNDGNVLASPIEQPEQWVEMAGNVVRAVLDAYAVHEGKKIVADVDKL